ncbi:hydrogenase expression/formation protein HypC [Parelusimicrobium proximum]|uniref:HypC/HybG/HupF family hydrogenase formation chaperone n=1 Tax=Parelusimicrobium proximum TaxID=3228953 RepID=UPI003D16EE0C
MCIASPGRVKTVEGQYAAVDFGGVEREASRALKPEAKAGDYVLVHAGFIIEILTEPDALERIQFFNEITK